MSFNIHVSVKTSIIQEGQSVLSINEEIDVESISPVSNASPPPGYLILKKHEIYVHNVYSFASLKNV